MPWGRKSIRGKIVVGGWYIVPAGPASCEVLLHRGMGMGSWKGGMDIVAAAMPVSQSPLPLVRLAEHLSPPALRLDSSALDSQATMISICDPCRMLPSAFAQSTAEKSGKSMVVIKKLVLARRERMAKRRAAEGKSMENGFH